MMKHRRIEPTAREKQEFFGLVVLLLVFLPLCAGCCDGDWKAGSSRQVWGVANVLDTVDDGKPTWVDCYWDRGAESVR